MTVRVRVREEIYVYMAVTLWTSTVGSMGLDRISQVPWNRALQSCFFLAIPDSYQRQLTMTTPHSPRSIRP